MRAVAVRLYLLAARFLEKLGWQVRHMTARGRRSGIRINWYKDEPELLRGAVRQLRVRETTLRFFIENDVDDVQSHHGVGLVYELAELDAIAAHFAGGTFVDVGANVGNHAIYALKLLNAGRAVLFEPEPLAARICEVNVALNQCGERVELHRFGLSDAAGRASTTYFEHNLGATRLSPADAGPIQLVRGDDVLGGEEVAFLKIDTEGYELKVLAGLMETIGRCRPPMLVEVENGNREAFESFCEAQRYEIAREFRRPEASNLLIVPGPAGGGERLPI
jgi:FkbM family methyltransferase